MPGNYDVTDKTYIRRHDRIDEDQAVEQAFAKYAENFSGMSWIVPHNLQSTNLLIGLWKYDLTSPSAFIQIKQIDANSLEVQWTAPTDGKIVIYSVRPFINIAEVFEQTTPSDVWTIPHNFGTKDILYTCWSNDELAYPTKAELLDDNTIELTFPAPIDGKCVLAVTDPTISPISAVDYNNLFNLPSCFPPCHHTHTMSDIIDLSFSATHFSGHPIEDFVLTTDIGRTVAPLLSRSATDPSLELPAQYLPEVLPFWVSDAGGELRIKKLIVDSEDPQPLFLQKYVGSETAKLTSKPVLRYVSLIGDNFIRNPSIPTNTAEVSGEFLIRLQMGKGLVAYLPDKNTIRIGMQDGLGRIFTRANLAPGGVWTLTDSIFNKPGEYALTLYESHSSSVTYSDESKHIVGQNILNVPFDVIGDDMLEMTGGKTTQDKVFTTANHYVYADDVRRSGANPVLAPTNTDAVYWDTVKQRYIMRSRDTLGYVFRTFEPSTNTFLPMITVLYADIPEWTTLQGGSVYALMPLTAGGFEIGVEPQSSISLPVWTTVAMFPTEPMPTVAGNGKLIFHVNGNTIVVLNTTLNSLAVYDGASQTCLSEKSLPKVAKDFHLWDDNYVSISFDGEMQLWVSDRPVTDNAYDWEKSIDFGMGATQCFAIRNDEYGALGIVSPTTVWYTGYSKHGPDTLYQTGEVTIWTRTPFCWTVSNFWSSVQSIAWEAFDTSAYDDVRIGFYPGGLPTLPDTLYRLSAGGIMTPFPSKDLPTLGQPLSEVSFAQLSGGDQLAYAIYIKKSPSKFLERGYITHNFLVTYDPAAFLSPLPLGGPYDQDYHILVKCGVGSVEIHNNTTRQLNGLKMIVVPSI